MIRFFPLSLFVLVLIIACQNNTDTQLAPQKTNALINETSPYLLQHAHNPVDWQPWQTAAFDKAKAENKLVIISVGYSACHWCHVMERETFEDSTTAAFMNEHFVSIKVDREERPDVDQVYMDAVQLMTQQGGWPLNCFALPNGKPIYGGTYFSKDSWMEVMTNLVDLKTNQAQKLENYAEELTKGINSMDQLVMIENNDALNPEKWDAVVNDWKQYWDTTEGGPNRAPKFPLPNNQEFLLHFNHQVNDAPGQSYVSTTLNKMIQGGIYDQIGGGFSRYATDELWKVPHFEKMLYDNAQLIGLYSSAYQKKTNPEFKRIINQTIEFMNQELSDPSGSFYSALDADSEGEEGKYYIWSKSELKELEEVDFEFLNEVYQINPKGKWENNSYILLRKASDQELAEGLNLTMEAYHKKLDQLHTKLLAQRNLRVPPGLDNKSITSWNALTVQGLCKSYRALGNDKHLERALLAAEFIWREQQHNGNLNRTWKEGKTSINAYLEDYAFTIEAYIELYQATFDEKWLDRARILLSKAIENFSNDENSMFYFTSKADSPLIARKLEIEDNVIPSGNSSMAKSLFLLGTLDGNEEWKKRSRQMLKNVQDQIDYAQNFSNWGILGLWHTYPFYEVAITGERCHELRKELDQNFLPNVIFLGGTSGSIPLLEGKFFDETTIFVCQNKTCQLPVNTSNEALSQIK